jgi:hypothetical protein
MHSQINLLIKLNERSLDFCSIYTFFYCIFWNKFRSIANEMLNINTYVLENWYLIMIYILLPLRSRQNTQADRAVQQFQDKIVTSMWFQVSPRSLYTIGGENKIKKHPRKAPAPDFTIKIFKLMQRLSIWYYNKWVSLWFN